MFELEGGTLEKLVQKDKENDVEIKWEVAYQVKQS